MCGICSSALAADISIESILTRLEIQKTFQCSVQVVQHSLYDTAATPGFVAWRDGRFFAHLGDEYYLKMADGKFFTWSEGADAAPVDDAFPIGDWRHTIDFLKREYSLSAKSGAQDIVLSGKCKDDESVVRSFEFTFDGDYQPLRFVIHGALEYPTEIIFDSPIASVPEDSLFIIPRGVEIIR